MKQRVITALVLIAIVAPLVFIGGYFTKALCLVGLVLATLEYVNNVLEKSSKLYYPITVLMCGFSLLGIYFKQYFMIVSSAEIIILFFLNVNDDRFNIEKIAYLYFMSHILIIGIDCFMVIRDLSIVWVFYILFITYITDSMALIGGMCFGKHKLNERISPKKTIEGAICGYLSGVITGLVFFVIFKASFVIIPSLIIPIVSQLGDLAFSSIKRYFKIKDFSNIFPGHGGMLDRIDSLIFALITFSMFLGVLV